MTVLNEVYYIWFRHRLVQTPSGSELNLDTMRERERDGERGREREEGTEVSEGGREEGRRDKRVA